MEAYLNPLLEFIIKLLSVFGNVLELGARSGRRDVARGQPQNRLHLETTRARGLQLRTQIVDLGQKGTVLLCLLVSNFIILKISTIY